METSLKKNRRLKTLDPEFDGTVLQTAPIHQDPFYSGGSEIDT